MANHDSAHSGLDLATGKLPDLATATSGSLPHRQGLLQYNDLAAKMPAKLKELQALFMTEATKYNVFRWITGFRAPPYAATERNRGRTVFTYTGENAGIPSEMLPASGQGLHITANLTIPRGGAEGMIVTLADDSAAMPYTCSKASRSSIIISSI